MARHQTSWLLRVVLLLLPVVGIMAFVMARSRYSTDAVNVERVVDRTRSAIQVRNVLARLRAQYEADPPRDRIQPWLDCLTADPSDSVDLSDNRLRPVSSRRSSGSTYWAYRALRPVTIRDRGATGQNAHPIDVLSEEQWQLEAFEPVELPDESIWLRRLWWEALGVPPTSKELQTLGERQAVAGPDWVDYVLSDPRFGEHQATFWLDLVRYADSNGYEEDEIREHAYSYRDFVIWAFNSDLPYRDFVRWQIAGDELEPDNPIAAAATGYLTAAPYNTFLPQQSERWDELDSIVATTGKVFLASTIGCARCHDHPYDLISTEDYYRLAAIFASTRRDEVYLSADLGAAYLAEAGDVLAYRAQLRKMMIRSLQYDKIIANEDFTAADIRLLQQPLDPKNTRQVDLLSLCGRCLVVDPTEYTDDWLPVADDHSRYEEIIAALAEKEPQLPVEPPKGLVISGSDVVSLPILHGGSVERPGRHVLPSFPASLSSAGLPNSTDDWMRWDASSETARPRTALANWMTDHHDGAGALLARVIVNRIWQQYFGRGLVETTSDFGGEGKSPQHEALLDYLAWELVRQHWSLKSIHRLILTSKLYRCTRHFPPSTADLTNSPGSLWCVPRRLTAEMFYDSLLLLGGNLNPQMYGPAYQPAIPLGAIYFRDESDPDATWPTQVPPRPAIWRRAVYAMRRRSCPIPLLQLLDAPDRFQSCEMRQNTIVPTQMLLLMNDPFVQQQCHRIAIRVLASVEETTPPDLIRNCYQLILGRMPSPDEVAAADRFLLASSLADLVHVLLLSNEYWYIQ